MSRQSTPPSVLLPGPFLASAAWELGVSSKRLRANDLSGAVWGTRLPAAQAHDLRRRCAAYALRLPDHAESPAESMMRVELAGAGLPKLRVTADVRDDPGDPSPDPT